MGFWIFMFIMSLLIPATMIGFGGIFVHRPPKNINSIYGYRTRRSMKNQESWDFAHQYCGKRWLRDGLVLLVVSVLVMTCVWGRNEDLVGYVGGALVFAQMIPMIWTIWPTERELKKRFGE